MNEDSELQLIHLLHTPERDADLTDLYNRTRIPGEAKIPADVQVSRIWERIQNDYKAVGRKVPKFHEAMDMIAKGYR